MAREPSQGDPSATGTGLAVSSGIAARAACAALAVVVALAGCGSGGGSGSDGADELRFTAAPRVEGPPSAVAPLARIVRVETNVAARVEITLADAAGHTVTAASAGAATSHATPILGLRPGRRYGATITAVGAGGVPHIWPEPFAVETAPLPPTFPVLEVLVLDSAATEPGFLLFGTRNKDMSAGYLVVLDPAGEVVWYAELPTTGVVAALPGGTLATLLGDRRTIQEIDLLGETVGLWYAARNGDPPPPGATPVDVFNFHNDVVSLAGGDGWLSLTGEAHLVEDFPVDETDPSLRATVPVLDEPVVEFGRDGTVRRQYRFLELLNPRRIGYDGTLGLPTQADWVHSNAVLIDPAPPGSGEDDGLLVSLRHQDAVVRIARTAGTLEWILGPHANWEGFERFLLTPVGEPFAWPYHPHAPQVTARGTLLVFDNGNARASPFTGEPRVPAAENHSRAVEYAIDAEARTVRQVWEFVHPERLYAPFVGSAYEQPTTGNVLIAFGGLCTIDGAPSDDIPACRGTARIVEVERGTPERIVLEVALRDRDPDAIGWYVYRAVRIPRLDAPL